VAVNQKIRKSEKSKIKIKKSENQKIKKQGNPFFLFALIQ
jgi:hypothetical protein